MDRTPIVRLFGIFEVVPKGQGATDELVQTDAKGPDLELWSRKDKPPLDGLHDSHELLVNHLENHELMMQIID